MRVLRDAARCCAMPRDGATKQPRFRQRVDTIVC